MTVYDIYDQTIRSLPAGERLQLARLILDDLPPHGTLDPAVEERPTEVRDHDELEELLLAGLGSGPAIDVTPEYWRQKRAALLERHTHKDLTE
jgi:hypothetical protein